MCTIIPNEDESADGTKSNLFMRSKPKHVNIVASFVLVHLCDDAKVVRLHPAPHIIANIDLPLDVEIRQGKVQVVHVVYAVVAGHVLSLVLL
jgi:hypothetical protein